MIQAETFVQINLPIFLDPPTVRVVKFGRLLSSSLCTDILGYLLNSGAIPCSEVSKRLRWTLYSGGLESSW